MGFTLIVVCITNMGGCMSGYRYSERYPSLQSPYVCTIHFKINSDFNERVYMLLTQLKV